MPSSDFLCLCAFSTLLRRTIWLLHLAWIWCRVRWILCRWVHGTPLSPRRRKAENLFEDVFTLPRSSASKLAKRNNDQPERVSKVACRNDQGKWQENSDKRVPREAAKSNANTTTNPEPSCGWGEAMKMKQVQYSKFHLWTDIKIAFEGILGTNRIASSDMYCNWNYAT